MTAMPVESAELNEGVIDLFGGVWVCDQHLTKMKSGVPCAFCAVEENGFEILDELAQD